MGSGMDVTRTFRSILTNRIVLAGVLPALLALFVGKQLAGNPSYWINVLKVVFFVLFFWFTFYSVSKNRNYLVIVLFSLLIISPWINTGLSFKGHTRFNELFLFAIIPLLFVVMVIKREKIRFTKIDLWFPIMAISMLISIFWGYARGVGYAYVDFSYIIYVLMFWMYFKVGQLFDVDKKVVSIAVLVPLISILLMDVISIVQETQWGLIYLAPHFMPERTMNTVSTARSVQCLFRLSGIVGSPNSFAMIVVTLLSLLMSWRLYIGKYDYLVILISIFSFVVNMLTFSRNGLLIFVLSQGYLLVMAKRDGLKNVFRKMIPYLLIVALATPFLYKVFLFQFRFASLFESDSRSYGLSDTTDRLFLWKAGLDRAMYNPLWGRGPVSAEPDDDFYFLGSYSPHSEYITVFIRDGLIGLGLFIFFFMYIFWKSCLVVKAGRNDYKIMFLGRSIQAIILALGVFSFFDGFWYNNVIPPILMVLFGVLYSFDKQTKRELANV